MALPKILAMVMIVSSMLAAGVQVDRQQLIDTLRNYSLLGRALLVNFVLIPLVAVLLVRGFHVRPDVSIGILLMSMAPGVPFLVNAAARKQGGSLSFAIEIAFLFSALSVVTIPITADLVFPPDTLAQIPVQKFLTTLVIFQLVPLLAGALIAPRLNAAQVERTTRVLHLIFLAFALVLVVVIFPKLVASIGAVYGSGHLLIIAGIGVFSAGSGWLLGGPNRAYRRTLSVASILRNVGLCALISTDAFEGTLVLPAVIAYFLVTFLLSLPLRIYFQRTKDAAAAAA